ncbi:hypothetical protein QQS21_006929 [Conoideocrella luteorostrata]|uniref:Uncharacterized protein n=1 Tax=Conoideocrella luteorostrata TaxID=1105319 RepID=A0AAJ0CLT0_9HYPO|nr:hypothetical protein QQS21_006929 [Conoideocrella luteorostrata]
MSTVDDSQISVRFKHGVHTIYLFVDTTEPMSEVSKELIELLRERYPTGLTTSIAPPRTTPVPSDPELAYGVLNVPNDPSSGWKRIKTGEGEVNTPTKCGLKNNSIVAFTFVTNPDDDDVLFEVDWPKDDDDLYEQAA